MEFVTIEIAKKLKEKGFAEKCLAYYVEGDSIILNESMPESEGEVFNMENLLFSCNRECSESMFDAPTISQVLKWLRNEKKIFVNVDIRTNLEWYYEVWNINEKLSVLGNVHFNKCESYEEAAIAGVEYALDNLVCNIYNGNAM